MIDLEKLAVAAASTTGRHDVIPLPAFAVPVNALAATYYTAPFSGRLAIAQAFELGVQYRLWQGRLCDFKLLLSKAARQELVELERCDAAIALCDALIQNSHVAFGRDCRHFIVNDSQALKASAP